MVLKSFKHYKDIFWLFYKYGSLDLFKNFSPEFDVNQLIQDHGEQKGKAEDLAHDLERLGPFYIKLGQILSAESHLLPYEYEEALEKLQDKAEPMSYEEVKKVIQDELGDIPENLFVKFAHVPLSAASLGQVHLAELPDGQKVAIKVQRRNIQPQILEQLDALKSICEYLEKTEIGKRYHVIEKFENLKYILLNELDYLKEAQNLKIFSQNMKEFPHLIVPLPVDKYTTTRVLTMNYIKGEKITDLSESVRKNLASVDLAKELYQAFLKQILVDGFFQMDPHPGNIYLTYFNQEPSLALFDLGMVARIPFQMQGKLIQCLIAMSEGREVDVSAILIALGLKLPQFNEYFFRSRIGDLIANYRGLAIDQVPTGKVVLKLSQIAAEAGLWLPIQMNMLGKTLLSLTSILKALDPKLNPNLILKDYATELLNYRLSKQLTTQSVYAGFLEGVEFVGHLPTRLNQLFDYILQNDFQLKLHLRENEPLAKNFEKIANRITIGILLAALLIAAALMMQVETTFRLFGYPGFAMVFLLLAAAGAFLLIGSILVDLGKK